MQAGRPEIIQELLKILGPEGAQILGQGLMPPAQLDAISGTGGPMAPVPGNPIGSQYVPLSLDRGTASPMTARQNPVQGQTGAGGVGLADPNSPISGGGNTDVSGIQPPWNPESNFMMHALSESMKRKQQQPSELKPGEGNFSRLKNSPTEKKPQDNGYGPGKLADPMRPQVLEGGGPTSAFGPNPEAAAFFGSPIPQSSPASAGVSPFDPTSGRRRPGMIGGMKPGQPWWGEYQNQRRIY